MASLLSEAHQGRCYHCHRVGESEAYYSNICMYHQILISRQLFVHLARSGRFGKFWREDEMVTMALLHQYIWAVMLVTLGQFCLSACYLFWPRIQRIMHCPWCWQQAGIANEFPPPWSSTICSYHDRQMREQFKKRRLARQLVVTPTKPAVAVRPPEEMYVWSQS